MDNDIREAFATLFSQLSTVGNDARRGAETSNEALLISKKLEHRFDGLESDVNELKKAVFGSNPPPPPPPRLTPSAGIPAVPRPTGTIVKRITNNEGEIAEISGQVLGVKADIASFKEEIKKDVEGIKTINDEQTVAITKLGSDIKSIYSAVSGFFGNPKVIMTGRLIFAGIFAYAVSKGWIAK